MKGERVTFECTDLECEAILDGLTDALTEHGVDEGGEVNAFGRAIDELIDHFVVQPD